jgi:hypothetical protein
MDPVFQPRMGDLLVAPAPTGRGRGINMFKIKRAIHLLRIRGYGGQVGKL